MKRCSSCGNKNADDRGILICNISGEPCWKMNIAGDCEYWIKMEMEIRKIEKKYRDMRLEAKKLNANWEALQVAVKENDKRLKNMKGIESINRKKKKRERRMMTRKFEYRGNYD